MERDPLVQHAGEAPDAGTCSIVRGIGRCRWLGWLGRRGVVVGAVAVQVPGVAEGVTGVGVGGAVPSKPTVSGGLPLVGVALATAVGGWFALTYRMRRIVPPSKST
jgi:hypothetical protein